MKNLKLPIILIAVFIFGSVVNTGVDSFFARLSFEKGARYITEENDNLDIKNIEKINLESKFSEVIDVAEILEITKNKALVEGRNQEIGLEENLIAKDEENSDVVLEEKYKTQNTKITKQNTDFKNTNNDAGLNQELTAKDDEQNDDAGLPRLTKKNSLEGIREVLDRDAIAREDEDPRSSSTDFASQNPSRISSANSSSRASASRSRNDDSEAVQYTITKNNSVITFFTNFVTGLTTSVKNKLADLSGSMKTKISSKSTYNLALATGETEDLSRNKAEEFAVNFYRTVNLIFKKPTDTTIIVQEEEVYIEITEKEESKEVVQKITQPITQTTIVNPIQERIIETTVERIVSGVTLADLQTLNNELKSEIYRVANDSTTQTSNNYKAIALTNKIDNLSSVTINNSTITGGTITDATITGAIFSGSTLSLTGTVTAGSGTFSGGVSAATGSFSDDISTAGSLTVSGTATSTMAGDFAFDTNTLYIDSVNNRVGIGTTSPSDTLAINGATYLAPISAPLDTTDRLYNVSNDLYWAGNLIGGATSANWTLSGSDAYRATGNVGVGTTSPFAKLSVSGNGYFDGTLTASTFTATSTTATSTFSYLTATQSNVGTVVGGTWNASSIEEVYGGTGQTTYTAGDILYSDSSNSLAKLPKGTNGQVLKLESGLPSWGTDTTGSGGGNGYWATTTDSLAVYTTDTSDVVIIGSNATTSTGYVFEVAGNALIPYASTTNITVSGNSYLGTVSSGVWNGTAIGDAYLTKTGNWTGTFDGQEGSYYLNASNLTNFGGQFYTYFNATTTDVLSEGSTNFWSDQARWDSFWNASTTNTSLTTLANLSITESQVSDLNHFDGGDFYTYFNATTTDYLTEGSSNLYWTNTRFDNRLTATTTLPNLTTLLGLTNASTTQLTVTNDTWLATAGGNVGIGTTSPYTKLSVAGFINTDGTVGGYKIDGDTVLQASSTNFSILVGQDAGKDLLADGTYNTALGYQALYTATSSDRNTAVGSFSLYSNTTGYSNIANGYTSLYSNTTGFQNTANGVSSLSYNTTGNYNTANGISSLSYNTTGNYNTASGGFSLHENTTGGYNSAFGYGSNYYNASATSTTAIGYQAGYGVSGQSYNQNGVLLGYKAGFGLTTGDNNLLLGYQAGDNLTTGDTNIVIGYDIDSPTAINSNTMTIGNLIYGTGIDGTGTTISSGNIGIGTTSPSYKLDTAGFINTDGTVGGYKIDGNTVLQASSTNFSTLAGIGTGNSLLSSGIKNTALGYQALYTATSSDNNTAVGYQSLYSNTTGNYNTASGLESLYSNTTGYNNSSFGHNSLNLNTTGSSNSSFGLQSLLNNTTGSSNSAFGNSALESNITGINNVAFGNLALKSNETGNYNTALGASALYYNTSATSTVAIGYRAGYGVSGQSYNQNGVLLGYQSGYGLTTGDNNLLLGYKSGDNLTTGDTNIVIGYDIDSPTATNSNTMTIGNLIYGTGIDGTGTTVSTGNVGIGTSSPATPLHVFKTGVDVWEQLRLQATGETGYLSMGIGSADAVIQTDTTSNKDLYLQYVSSGDVILVNGGGNVGIRDSSPSYDLDVNANINYQGNLTNVSDIRFKKDIFTFENSLEKINTIRGVSYKWRVDEFPDRNWSDQTNIGVIAQEVESIIPEMVFTADDGYKSVDYTRFTPVLIEAVKELDVKINSIATNSSTSTSMYVENGNIGIGTTSPEYKLHVIGDIAATSFVNISTVTAKKDISYLVEEDNVEILSKIGGMSIARYRYNIENETDPLRLGLIAEESPEEILSADGKGVDIYKLSTFILAGVKAQQNRLDELELRIANLEAQSVEAVGSVSVQAVFDYMEGLGVKMMANVVEFRGVVMDSLSSSQIYTNLFCIDDLCIGKDEFKKLLLSADIDLTTLPKKDSTVSASESEVVQESNNEAPTIKITPDNPALIEIDSTYIDMGVIAQDSNGNDLSVSVSVSEVVQEGDDEVIQENITISQINLDTSTSTTYVISYSIVDNNGLTAEAERTVIVEEANSSQPTADSNNEETPLEDTVVFDGLPLTGQADTTAPTILLMGSDNIEIELNETYTDKGATATDDIDGDITTNIVVGGEVDTTTVGIYTITYNVTDTAGNEAVEVIRIVIVTEPVVIPGEETPLEPTVTDGDLPLTGQAG